MRACRVHDCRPRCNSPRTSKSDCAEGAEASSGRAPAASDRGAITRILSIPAKPSVRRSVTPPAMAAPRGSLLASTIGITAMIGGVRLKIKSGRKIGAATANPMIVQRQTTVATVAGPRKPNRDRCDFVSSAAGSHVATGSTSAAWTDSAASVLAGMRPVWSTPLPQRLGPQRLGPQTGNRGRTPA